MSDIADRIRKLLALAGNNTNEAEAAAAMSKASALMLQHGLTTADVDRAASSVGYGSTLPLERSHERTLAHAVDALYGTRHVILRSANAIRFAGREENVGAAEITFAFIVKQVDAVYRAHLPPRLTKSQRAAYRNDFKKACSERVYSRAVDARMQQAAAASTSRALVVAHIETLQAEVENFFSTDGVKSIKTRAVRIRDSQGTRDGVRAAEQVALHQQMKG